MCHYDFCMLLCRFILQMEDWNVVRSQQLSLVIDLLAILPIQYHTVLVHTVQRSKESEIDWKSIFFDFTLIYFKQLACGHKLLLVKWDEHPLNR